MCIHNFIILITWYLHSFFYLQSGFSFDKDFERDREHHPFRSQLDDLAQRHPEFAEHLNFGNTFPFRSNLRERDRGRWGSQEHPSGSQDPFEEYRRFTDRPFGPRFERFPFQRRFPDEPGFERHSQSPQPQQQQQQTPQQPQTAPVQNPPEEKQNRPEPQQSDKKAANPNLVQSNTVDLGQKQEPVDDKRNQRSMSAPPPDNRGGPQRFISTFSIPIQKENAGGGEPQTEQKQHQSRMAERVIPIHVEGRDEPVVPKNANHTFTQPQPERIFGQKPSHFTQFVNRPEPQQHFSPGPEQVFRQQNFPQQKQATPPPPAQEKPQPQEKQPHPGKLTPSDQIQAIQKDVLELMDQVEKFTGKYRDKQYLYLDEMLTRNLIKLDNIETEGKDAVRQARKEAIKCVQKCISILEAKAAANDPEAAKPAEGDKMEVETAEEKPQENSVEQNTESTAMDTEPIQQLEVAGVVKSGTQANVPEAAMEVAAAEAKPAETENKPSAEVKEIEGEAKNAEVNTETRAVLVQDVKTEDAQEEEKKEEKSKEKKKGKKKEKVEKK